MDISQKVKLVNIKLVDTYKVFVQYASPGDDSYPHAILSNQLLRVLKLHAPKPI